jgi:hypothetical protein
MRFAWMSWLLLGIGGAVLAAGCGSSVTIGGDGSGGQGAGGGSAGTGNVQSCQPKSSCNPPSCPFDMPTAWDSCPAEGVECFYDDGPCEVGIVCEAIQECWDGAGNAGPGSSGSGGDCTSTLYWQNDSATCSPPAVPCESAQNGDPCALVGDSCGEGYECAWIDKYCQADHTWLVAEYYDDCCYDDCYCDPYYCPPELPEPGTFCDPCFDASYCEYVVDSPCGPLFMVAGCADDDYTWHVDGDGCLGSEDG